MNAVAFIHDLQWGDLPADVQDRTKLCLLDLIGVGIAGRLTDLSRIIHAYAATEHPGPIPLPFDDQTASATGVALAYGMTIDSIDAHDGFNPAKGHIGCPLWPAVLVNAITASGKEILAALAMGYEFGARCSIAQHGSVSDYHTSGSWGAVAAAAASAKLQKLDLETTRHALGIAEYHGPRSQMMRVIDHPTMLKDGSGWGAMCGVSAARLAQAGFTGAPAIIVEDQPDVWADLGQHWYLRAQYFKPYPICRWAQAPVEAVLALRAKHDLVATDIAAIEIATFHEAIRLACAVPQNTEQAQYSTSFPVAVAAVRGTVQAEDLVGQALHAPAVLRLSKAIKMVEVDHANAAFPLRRYARVTLKLHDGTTRQSDWVEPKWEHTTPPTSAELLAKFNTFAVPAIGALRAERIVKVVLGLDNLDGEVLHAALSGPLTQTVARLRSGP